METEKGLYIMLADDDSDDRFFFSEVLEEYKHVALESIEDGVKLMNALNSRAKLPDLIFLDLNMPGKNGVECLSEIRQQDKLKDIPVIIFSTSSSKKDIDETFDLGANLYITKPHSFKVLKNIGVPVLLFFVFAFQSNVLKAQYNRFPEEN